MGAEGVHLHVDGEITIIDWGNSRLLEAGGISRDKRHTAGDDRNQFLDEMGYVAVQMLIKLIGNEPLEVQVHKIPTRLVERTSCRALAGASLPVGTAESPAS